MAVDSRRISIAPDTDVVPDPVPVQMATTAVESLCPPVVTQTRPKEGCDPASPRRLRRVRDVLTEDSMVAVDTRRISIDQDTDVVSGLYVMLGCILDGRPLEGTPVLEPSEHSVLEKSSHDEPMEEAPVLEPLEHSVLGKPLDGGSLEGRSIVDWFDSSWNR